MKTFSVAVILVFLIGLCVTAVYAGDPANDNREEIIRSLRMLGLRAQEYYHTLTYEGGGGGSFANTTLASLTQRPANANGSFVLSSPNSSSVTLTGTGIETGNDGSSPVNAVVIVYSDSMVITVNN